RPAADDPSRRAASRPTSAADSLQLRRGRIRPPARRRKAGPPHTIRSPNRNPELARPPHETRPPSHRPRRQPIPPEADRMTLLLLTTPSCPNCSTNHAADDLTVIGDSIPTKL